MRYFTHNRALCNRIFLEKLVVTQLIRKISTFYENTEFTALSTIFRLLSPFRARSCQSVPHFVPLSTSLILSSHMRIYLYPSRPFLCVVGPFRPQCKGYQSDQICKINTKKFCMDGNALLCFGLCIDMLHQHFARMLPIADFSELSHKLILPAKSGRLISD